MLLAFFLPTFNLNSMHIVYPLESPIKVVKNTKWMLVITALVAAAVQVTPSRQVNWNSCRFLLFFDKLKCKIWIITSIYFQRLLVYFFIFSFSKGVHFSKWNNYEEPSRNNRNLFLQIMSNFIFHPRIFENHRFNFLMEKDDKSH